MLRPHRRRRSVPASAAHADVCACRELPGTAELGVELQEARIAEEELGGDRLAGAGTRDGAFIAARVTLVVAGWRGDDALEGRSVEERPRDDIVRRRRVDLDVGGVPCKGVFAGDTTVEFKGLRDPLCNVTEAERYRLAHRLGPGVTASGPVHKSKWYFLCLDQSSSHSPQSSSTARGHGRLAERKTYASM